MCVSRKLRALDRLQRQQQQKLNTLWDTLQQCSQSTSNKPHALAAPSTRQVLMVSHFSKGKNRQAYELVWIQGYSTCIKALTDDAFLTNSSRQCRTSAVILYTCSSLEAMKLTVFLIVFSYNVLMLASSLKSDRENKTDAVYSDIVHTPSKCKLPCIVEWSQLCSNIYMNFFILQMNFLIFTHTAYPK